MSSGRAGLLQSWWRRLRLQTLWLGSCAPWTAGPGPAHASPLPFIFAFGPRPGTSGQLHVGVGPLSSWLPVSEGGRGENDSRAGRGSRRALCEKCGSGSQGSPLTTEPAETASDVPSTLCSHVVETGCVLSRGSGCQRAVPGGCWAGSSWELAGRVAQGGSACLGSPGRVGTTGGQSLALLLLPVTGLTLQLPVASLCFLFKLSCVLKGQPSAEWLPILEWGLLALIVVVLGGVSRPWLAG